MAAILARLIPSRYSYILTMIALMNLWAPRLSGEASAYSGSRRVYAEDAVTYLSELGLANQRCDMDWLTEHILPTAQLTFTIQDGPSVTMSRKQYVESIRETCGYRRIVPSFKQRGWSVNDNGSSTVVKMQFGKGEYPPFVTLGTSGRKPESVEQTLTFIRDESGVVQLQSVYSLEVLFPKDLERLQKSVGAEGR